MGTRYKITRGEHQGDPTAATVTTVAAGISTLRECRRIIRRLIGAKSLRRERRWHRPSPDVVEGWCESLDPTNETGYFIREY